MRELNAEKAGVRKAMKRLRDCVADRPSLDDALCRELLSLPPFLEADAVLLYVSAGSEAGTREILLAAMNSGKQVYVPRCETGRVLRFYEIRSFSELSPGAFGIPEPKEDPLRLWRGGRTVCLVPGLAFTARGERIGYGGGYYDRFLPGSNAVRVGVCYDFQIVPALPTEAHDVKMDWIVTDRRCICCRNGNQDGKGEIQGNE